MINLTLPPKEQKSFQLTNLLAKKLDEILAWPEVQAMGIKTRRALLIAVTVAVHDKWSTLESDLKEKDDNFPKGTTGVIHNTDFDDKLKEIVASKAGVHLTLGSAQNLVVAATRHLVFNSQKDHRVLKNILDIKLGDLEKAHKKYLASLNDDDDGSSDKK